MEINVDPDEEDADVLFESIGDPSPRMITPYLSMDLYNMYDQYDIITKLAFTPYQNYIYVVLYDSPTELMLNVLYTIIPELRAFLREQPNTSLMFHCHQGPNVHVTLSLSYLCPVRGSYYQLMIRTLHYYQDIRLLRQFMEERKRRLYPTTSL